MSRRVPCPLGLKELNRETLELHRGFRPIVRGLAGCHFEREVDSAPGEFAWTAVGGVVDDSRWVN